MAWSTFGDVAVALGLVAFLPDGATRAEPIKYPPARKADVVDDYHGTKVADPYRWLENAEDPETAAWVEAENKLTASLLGGSEHEALKKRLQELFDYARVSVPEQRGGRYFYLRNTGLQNQSDHLRWAKFTSLAWTPDGKGFFYSRFPPPGTVPSGDENYYCKVYHHRLGEGQDEDALVYERPEEKEVVFASSVTRDGRFLLVTAFRGASGKSEVFARDLKAPGAPMRPVFTGFADVWRFVDEVDGRFYFQTDKDAPLGRVVAVDLGRGQTRPAEVLSQGKDKLEAAAIVDRKLVAIRLRNANSRVELFALDGRPLGTVELPTIGTVAGLTGEPDQDEMFLGFTSYTCPATPFRYDFKTGVLAPFEKAPSKVDGAAYEVEQVFYPSKDGTKVSMFLVRRKGLPKDTKRPTLRSEERRVGK